MVDTREQVAELNAAIRDRLVAAGRVDDTAWSSPPGRGSGSGSGTGSPPAATTATSTSPTATSGSSPPSAATAGSRHPGRRHPAPAPCANVSRRCHPGRRRRPRCCRPTTSPRHVELAYATTAHGAQGDTVTAAHLVIGEHTGAASAYVGMTRGRAGQHRPPGRRRRRRGAGAVDRRVRPRPRRPRPRPRRPSWPPPRPPATPRPGRWSRCWPSCAQARTGRAALPGPAGRPSSRGATRWPSWSPSAPTPPSGCPSWRPPSTGPRPPPSQARRAGRGQPRAVVAADADRIRDELLAAWDAQRGDAAARRPHLWAGPGRFGLHRGAVTRAGEQLTALGRRLARRSCRPAHRPPADRRDRRPVRLPARPVDGVRRRRPPRRPKPPTPSTPRWPPRPRPPRAAADARGQALADARRQDADRAARFGRLADTARPRRPARRRRPRPRRHPRRARRRPGAHRHPPGRPADPPSRPAADQQSTSPPAGAPRRRPNAYGPAARCDDAGRSGRASAARGPRTSGRLPPAPLRPAAAGR